MRIGIAADHGGFDLKAYLAPKLKASGVEVVDFGAFQWASAFGFSGFDPLGYGYDGSHSISNGIIFFGFYVTYRGWTL